MKRQVKKFERKLNPDTATAEKLQQTNEQLYEYLQQKGEKDAAKQIAYLMNNQATGEHEDPKKNPVYDKLLVTNNKILEILSKMQRDMIDEQDTSIKPVSKAPAPVAPAPVIQPTASGGTGDSEDGDDDGGLGLTDMLGLGSLLKRGKKVPGKVGKGAKTVSKKAGKAAAKKASKSVAKKAGGNAAGKIAAKVGTKMAGKAALGALKFAGPVGAVIAAGMSIYDGVEGWNKAGETFDKAPGEEVTTGEKASSAAGGVISGLTFGLADAKDTSIGIHNMFGGNDTINKYEKSGIIEHHTFGSSAVKDWTGLAQLPSKEIQKIIDIDDWTDEDLERLKEIKVLKESSEVKVPNIPEATQSPQTAQKSPTKPAVQSGSTDKANPGEGGGTPGATTTQSAGAGRGFKNPERVNVTPVSGDEEVKAMIKRHEGVRNKPYKDSLGLWTVGVGHLIGDGKTLPPEYDRTFSDDEINALFEEDYAVHKKYAEQIPGFDKLNETGQGALTDLTFNMGGKWYKRWPKFTKNISEGNTDAAAESLEDSKWYGQVGNRAPEIVAMVRAGNDEGATGATSTKNAGSGVVPQKTSEAQVAKTEKSSAPTEVAMAETNKDQKENIVNKTNENLKNQTVAYDTGTQARAMNTIVPVINNSINSTKQPENVGQDRLLNLFT